MGQVLPLPEKIPRPNSEQTTQLSKYGISVVSADDKQRYVEVVLPEIYIMHNNSFQEDIPDWYILRKGTNKACAQIYGAWKGTYDNELKLYVYDEEKTIKIRETAPEPSETNEKALLQQAAETGDPAVIKFALRAANVLKEK